MRHLNQRVVHIAALVITMGTIMHTMITGMNMDTTTTDPVRMRTDPQSPDKKSLETPPLIQLSG